MRRLLMIFFIILLILLLAMDTVFAQCAMCRQALENSTEGGQLAQGMNLAILILLVPPVVMFIGLFALAYRYRNPQGN